MTNPEIEFLKDIQAVLVKHKVRVSQETAYYPGESETITFHVPYGTSYITIHDVADKTGGVQ